jgi:hypothetical protein
VTACRLDRKVADETRSYPAIRDQTCIKETRRYIEGEKAESFRKCECSEPAAFSLYPAHTLTTCLCSCKVQRIEQCLSLISGVA